MAVHPPGLRIHSSTQEAHDGYHINVDHYPTRIVDEQGQDVAPGDTGEVVMSNLVNRATVLLNYRLGDVAQRIDVPCPCGRNLPRIGFVQDRTLDALTAMDGRRVPCTVLERALRDGGDVYQYQAVQEARDRLTIQYVPALGCRHEAVEERVRAAARDALGEGMQVTMSAVESIARPSGKWRFVINRVSNWAEAPASSGVSAGDRP